MKTATDRQLGARAYSQAHARVGDSTDPVLGDSTARKMAPHGTSIDEFVAGWRGARETHLRERAMYAMQAWIPLAEISLG